MRLGVHLPTFDPLRVGASKHVIDVARDAERCGFDGVWVGDHLLCPAPVLEATACLAAAAAATTQIGLGFSVLLAGLRQPAWTAKQLQTIDALAPGRRLVLGVGVGGEFPAELAAAGVPQKKRGVRLEETLDVLPGLLAGQAVAFEGQTLTVTATGLEPPIATVPAIYIGGRGEPALSRAARRGDGWLPVFLSPQRVRSGDERLAELAAANGRAKPPVCLVLPVAVDADPDRARAQADRYTRGQYNTPFERFEPHSAVGTAEQVAERIADYDAAGVDELVLMPITPDPSGQTELLAGVRELLGYAGAR